MSFKDAFSFGGHILRTYRRYSPFAYNLTERKSDKKYLYHARNTSTTEHYIELNQNFFNPHGIPTLLQPPSTTMPAPQIIHRRSTA